MKISKELKQVFSLKRSLLILTSVVASYLLFVVWPVMKTKDGNIFLLIAPAAIMIPAMLFFLWNLNKALLCNEEINKALKKEKRLQQLN